MAKKPTGYKKLRDALLGNLAARGLIEPMYVDRVNEYMELWKLQKALDADIAERGVMVMDEKRGMLVDNIAVSRKAQLSQRMSAIFTELGFKELAVKSQAPPESEDEL